MKSQWQVIYYETETGKSFVEDFIEAQNIRNQAKILNLISLLEEKGSNLPRPYADLLSDGIHELRIKISGDQSRILYFFCFQKYIVLTNTFIKTTDKVPSAEINKANQYRNDFLKRFTKKDLEAAINENI